MRGFLRHEVPTRCPRLGDRPASLLPFSRAGMPSSRAGQFQKRKKPPTTEGTPKPKRVRQSKKQQKQQATQNAVRQLEVDGRPIHHSLKPTRRQLSADEAARRKVREFPAPVPADFPCPGACVRTIYHRPSGWPLMFCKVGLLRGLRLGLRRRQQPVRGRHHSHLRSPSGPSGGRSKQRCPAHSPSKSAHSACTGSPCPPPSRPLPPTARVAATTTSPIPPSIAAGRGAHRGARC